MKRRDFLGATAGLSLGTLAGIGRGEDKPGRQLLELRTYQFASAEKQEAFDRFLARAAVPALNKAGITPVGVFKILKEDNLKEAAADGFNLYVLLPHDSPESFLTLPYRLASDKSFLETAGPVWEAPKADPAYVRFQSSILLAFKGFPRVQVPTKAATRILQLRIYESHCMERALKKIEMFNEGGEIEIFHRCGLTPVFFGQALAGAKLPNLTYMLSFPDQATQDKTWSAFRVDPGWLKLKDDPAYKDTVSTVTNLILRPATSSQV